MKKLKIVAISDTHEYHRKISLPDADVLIHCGDWTYRGESETYLDAFNWLVDQSKRYKHIIVIMGNHDFNHQYFVDLIKNSNISNIHYLENSGVEIEGTKFFGCPFVPNLPNWAFPEYPGCYDKIPDDTQILISHAPVKGILDNNSKQYGSSYLRQVVDKLMENRLTHFFNGHIHESYGIKEITNSKNKPITFINASTCNLQYKPIHPAVIVEINNE